MKRPPIPSDENERVSELIDSLILDSPPEPEFDRLTELASRICETPIAVISLVDSVRQWFKSHHGLTTCETPRDIAFCSYAILSDEPFIVEDALKDERFVSNPLVTGPLQVRAYLGHPLISANGFRLGSFAVIDQRARSFTDLQIQTVKTFAEQTVRLIELGRASKELRLAFRTISEGILIKSASGHILDLNDRAAEILGVPADILRGLNVEEHDWRAKGEDDLPLARSNYSTIVAVREKRPVYDHVHSIGEGANRKWLQVNSVPYIEPETGVVKFVVTSFRDITQMRQQQEAMIHRARMAAVGEMAAGVAHEVNNPLAIIVGNCAIMEGNFKNAIEHGTELNPETLQDRVTRIRIAAMRASKIVNGLLHLSRDSRGDQLQKLKLDALIQDALSFSKERLVRNDVRIEIQEIPQIEIKGNSNELSQVLINLINNAYDALKESPLKRIAIQFETINREEQNYIAISISDTGCGIPLAVRDRIMQPFFTTKGVGQGTGLGLSVSKSIAEKHSGRLYLDDRLNGLRDEMVTRFVLELPIEKQLEHPKSSTVNRAS